MESGPRICWRRQRSPQIARGIINPASLLKVPSHCRARLIFGRHPDRQFGSLLMYNSIAISEY